jgi:hypothetical protein
MQFLEVHGMATKQVLIVGTMTWDEGADSGNVPAHPIVLPPAQPPGIWGGAPLPVPTPPIYYPPVFPAHPIAPGGPPPGIWGPPTIGHHPAHPIAPGGLPPGIWGGGNVPMPTPPIYFPPTMPEAPPGGDGGGRWAYSPLYGWVWVPVGGGDKPHPPSGPPEAPVDPNAPVVTPH